MLSNHHESNIISELNMISIKYVHTIYVFDLEQIDIGVTRGEILKWATGSKNQ